MDKNSLLEQLQQSYSTNKMSAGRVALDDWESEQVRNRDSLSFLRFHRTQLGQIDAAIQIAIEMIAATNADTWTLMCDYLSLCNLYIVNEQYRDAWISLEHILEWSDLPDAYHVGLARSTVECAMDIAFNSSDVDLANRSFDSGMLLLDDGSSTSLNLCRKTRDAAAKLARYPVQEQYDAIVAANDEDSAG